MSRKFCRCRQSALLSRNPPCPPFSKLIVVILAFRYAWTRSRADLLLNFACMPRDFTRAKALGERWRNKREGGAGRGWGRGGTPGKKSCRAGREIAAREIARHESNRQSLGDYLSITARSMVVFTIYRKFVTRRRLPCPSPPRRRPPAPVRGAQ
jgi:hypothetical protein